MVYIQMTFYRTVDGSTPGMFLLFVRLLFNCIVFQCIYVCLHSKIFNRKQIVAMKKCNSKIELILDSYVIVINYFAFYSVCNNNSNRKETK